MKESDIRANISMKGTLIKTDGSETPITFNPYIWWRDIGKLISEEFPIDTIETFPVPGSTQRVFCDECAYLRRPLAAVNKKATEIYKDACGGQSEHQILGNVVIADFEELNSFFNNEDPEEGA